MKPEILFEDEYMIACIKPCGVPAQGDKSNEEDMISILKNYLFDRQDTDEEPYVAAIHRLDRPVGGIMIFAKDADTAAKLTDMVQDGKMLKYYQAVLTGTLPEEEGTFVDYILQDPKTNTSKLVPKEDKNKKGVKRAELNYEVLDEFDTDNGPLTYVLIELITGRHHQIRVQMAGHGAGIWGDTKYNPKYSVKNSGNDKGKPQQKKGGKKTASKPKKYTQIGLYASRLEFVHPVTGEQMVLKNEPEGEAFDAIELEEDLD